MQAIILCGGIGSRLDPLTQFIPKPMVPLNQKPHLEYQISLLKENGITNIILSTGYLHKEIEEYFGDGSRFGVQISYCEDGEVLLGTAGALKNCEPFVNTESIVVINGDILTDICIKNIMGTHTNSNQPITMTLIDVENAMDFGQVDFDIQERAIKFKEKGEDLEKNTLKHFINAGIYVINKEVLETIEKGKFSMLEKDVFPLFVDSRKVQCHLCYSKENYWLDIGTWERYLKAKEDTEKQTFFTN
ncbi:D-glycero-alpha-D-manno-heptose 1-phosphate guanylyltransferase [compost metagenome]